MVTLILPCLCNHAQPTTMSKHYTAKKNNEMTEDTRHLSYEEWVEKWSDYLFHSPDIPAIYANVFALANSGVQFSNWWDEKGKK
jgi:hypothetical protein